MDDSSSLPSSDSACFPSSLVSDFDGHIPFGKFQQELAQAWHPTSSDLLKSTRIPDNSFVYGSGRLSPAFAVDGVSTRQSFRDSSEIAGNSMVSESWDAGAGRKLSYSSTHGSILPASRNAVLESSITSKGPSLTESSTGVTELVARMEMHGNGADTISSIVASSPPLSEVERLTALGSGSWGSLNATGTMGLTIDPLKGGLAIQRSNLAPSCCLPDFSTDPGFAERAAKFSCFSNQNYPELAQRFSMPDSAKKLINRSAPRASDKLTPTKVMRITSGHLTPRCSAPNSPVGAAACGSAQGQSCTPESSYLRERQESVGNVDDMKAVDKLSGRTSHSPSRIEGSDRVQKHSTSMNDSEEADGNLGQEESSSWERGACDAVSQSLAEKPGKKRRIASKGRSKDPIRAANVAEVRDFDGEEDKVRRPNSGDEAKEGQMPKIEQSNSGNSGDSTPKSVKESSKPPEAGPKSDFIHVRARRGQATDSHSLAERVRREKISERMKFLQDLVPGCSKVTGKAVMLDEIINYVQSLQRQVEFLSMKLAAVNPRVDLNIESLFGREIFQPRIAPNSSLLFAPENSNSYPQLQQVQCTMQGGPSCPVDVHPLGSDPALRRAVSNPVATTVHGFGDSVSQISQAWDDELQSVVQMGFAQGRLLPGQLKIEL